MEIINKFIHANAVLFKKENIKNTKIVYNVFLVMTLCILPFTDSLVGIFGMIIILVYFIVARVYNHKIIKMNSSSFKQNFTSNVLLIGYLFIIFNLMLYGIPRVMKQDSEIFVILIIAFEIVCVALGCIYTYLSIKKDRVKESKKRSTLTSSVIFTLSGCWTIFLRRYVSTISVDAQAFFFLAIMAIFCCYLAFYAGKIYISMVYIIKKYSIDESVFANE